MSYVTRLECEIIPTNTFKIIRGCSGCGTKQTFSCTGKFRVNANGNQLDIWLIYGCNTCGHTYNLSIYERINQKKIPLNEYQKFLSNDESAVFRWGTDKCTFEKNKAEIDWSQNKYEIKIKTEQKENMIVENILLKVTNSYHMPIRTDKLVAEMLRITRKQARHLLQEEKIKVEKEKVINK